MNEQDVQRGFNKGYTLYKHAPQLAIEFQKLLTGREDAYATGFMAGIKEHEKELAKSKNKSPLKRFNLTKRHKRNHDKNKDRDDR